MHSATLVTLLGGLLLVTFTNSATTTVKPKSKSSPFFTFPACTKCSHTTPTVVKLNEGAKGFKSRTFGTNANKCSTQTLVCNGTDSGSTPSIEGANGSIIGTVGGSLTVKLTCNAAGKKWIYKKVPISQIECDAS